MQQLILLECLSLSFQVLLPKLIDDNYDDDDHDNDDDDDDDNHNMSLLAAIGMALNTPTYSTYIHTTPHKYRESFQTHQTELIKNESSEDVGMEKHASA